LLSSLAIVGACLAWALDKNCTSKISDVDPLTLTAIKGVAAGSANLILALAIGHKVPPLISLAAAGLVGLLG
jgi:hypothetical protein